MNKKLEMTLLLTEHNKDGDSNYNDARGRDGRQDRFLRFGDVTQFPSPSWGTGTLHHTHINTARCVVVTGIWYTV